MNTKSQVCGLAFLLAFSSLIARGQAGWPLDQMHGPLANQSIAQSSLSPTEKAGLRQALAPLVQEIDEERKTNPAGTTFEQLQLAKVALGLNGGSGYVVQGTGSLCGASNCVLYVVGTGMHLAITAGSVQTFAMTSIQSHGRFDFVTGAHESASVQYLQRWRYNGSRYRLIQCANADSSRPGAPVVRAIPCSSGQYSER